MTVSIEIAPQSVESPAAAVPSGLRQYFTRLATEPPAPWNATTIGGLVSLVLIWAAWFYGTWATWGSLTADCGREMYVPLVLSEGKTLYRDIWYLYGPAAPYFNSFLYRLFGAHLNVLYWAGSLSALGCTIFLYLAGMRLSSWLVGWTAGAVMLCQSFQATLFNFPLPYSFASVYGCLTACAFLWIVLNAATSSNSGWVFAAGSAAAIALLLKLEFGTACYVALALLIVARGLQRRPWKIFFRDVAATLPGMALCAIVIYWMISLRGAEFLTQENFMAWPTSYFMKTYGKFWMASTGFSINGQALANAAQRTFIFLGIVQGLPLLAFWKSSAGRVRLLRAGLFLGATVYLFLNQSWDEALKAVFFPRDLVLYVSIAAIAAWLYLWPRHGSGRGPAVAVALSFASLLAFRILLNTAPTEYAIYYDGPAVLCLLLLVRALLPESARNRMRPRAAELIACLGCLAVAFFVAAQIYHWTSDNAPLVTERGTIRVRKATARNYAEMIAFMKEKAAQGETVLSVPEDTSLYFLSGTHCPTRVFAFAPGILSPGKMTDELILEIEQKHVRYLIWSNRLFPEYNAPRFGKDFDQTLGDYFTSHYRRIEPAKPYGGYFGDWHAYIWERIPEGAPN
jgi:hypothetical protein